MTPPAAALGPVPSDYPPDRPSRAQRAAAVGIGVAGRGVVVRIRHRVRAEVLSMTGLRVVAVDVEVTDLDRRPPHR